MTEETANTPPAGGDQQQSTPPASGGQQQSTPPEDLLDSKGDDTAQGSPSGDLLSGDGDAADESVPDQYAFEPPEGVDPALIDEASLETFKGLAKDIGLSQSAFDKLVEFDLQRSQAAAEEAVSGWNERVDGWRDNARNDSEIGGKNFDATIKSVGKLVDQFGDDAFKAVLRSPSESNPDGLAIGNHPAVLRFLSRIAAKIGDPPVVEGDDKQTEDSSFSAKAARMYPSMQKNK
jgi:hypothetical protein